MTERGRLEVMTPDECLQLVAADEIGRLALGTGGTPEIFPVNYALADGEIIFRTDEGLKLTLAEQHQVAFEVDGLDRGAREGWSVVIKGRAQEVTVHDRPELRERVSSLALYPWAEGDRGHWVRIVPSQVSGRRVIHR
ncbi:MAG: pyridoxamine 5'-phosphate oxidase family protein [Actinomycetota bacterium]